MTEKGDSLSAYVAAGMALVAGLTLNDLAAVVGIVCAIVTAGSNVYFKWRLARRYERGFCEICPKGEKHGTKD